MLFPLLLTIAAGTQTKSTVQEQIADHLHLAQQYLVENQPRLAVPEYQAIVRLDPSNVDAHANLGALLFFEGNVAKACGELRAAVDLQSGLWKTQGLLGMCEARTGQEAIARRDLEEAFPQLQGDKTQIEVGRELIQYYVASGDQGKAFAVLYTLRNEFPTNTSLLYIACRLYSDLAAEAMLSLSITAPDSPQMHQVMAQEMERRGDSTGAIAQYRIALGLDPSLPGLHFELAEALNPIQNEGRGDKQEAITEYQAALAVNNRDEKADYRLGQIAAIDGDFSAAFQYFSRAVELAPTDADAMVGLASAYLYRSQSEKALSLLQRAVVVDPANAAAHYKLSAVYRQLGQTDKAKEEIEQYLKYRKIKDELAGIYEAMRIQIANEAVDPPHGQPREQ